MTATEVCLILDSCAKNGVSTLKFGALEASWVSHPPLVQNSLDAHIPGTEIPEINHSEKTKEALEVSELNLREEQLAMALIEDPEQYERLLAQGELEDEETDTDDEQSETPEET